MQAPFLLGSAFGTPFGCLGESISHATCPVGRSTKIFKYEKQNKARALATRATFFRLPRQAQSSTEQQFYSVRCAQMIPSADSAEVSPFPEHAKTLEALQQSQVAWNSEFQALYLRGKSAWSPASTKSELLRTVQLRKLALRFADHATQLGLIILKELSLPDSQKVIKPVTGTFGGIAGGQKYVCCGIFFKQPCDFAKLYASGAAAIKAAEHELKGTMAYLDCEIEGLHFPLMALIRYRGHALLAQSLLPIGADTIRYGTCDHAKTLHTDLPELNAKMEQAAKILNIKGHNVWTRNRDKVFHLFAPADVEGHLGTDNRFYVIDTARLFPPAAPRARAGIVRKSENTQLYQLLRPEMVKFHSVPLSSDALSRFGADKDQHTHDAEVLNATIWLEEERIPEFARYLEKRSADVKIFSEIHEMDDDNVDASGEESYASGVDQLLTSGDSSNPSEEIAHEELSHIVAEMHLHGVNVRYLLQVYYHLNDRNVRMLVITEAVSRVLKSEIAERWRKIQSCDQQAYVETLVSYINLVFGRSEESDKYWNGTLRALLLLQYPAPSTIFSRGRRHSTYGGASNNAGSCSSGEDESKSSPRGSLQQHSSNEEPLHDFFIRVAIGLHMSSPEKFAKTAKTVVGSLCSTVSLFRELVESQYWAKKVFSQNPSDNDMIKTHMEKILHRSKKDARPRSSSNNDRQLKRKSIDRDSFDLKKKRTRSQSSMDRILVTATSIKRKSFSDPKTSTDPLHGSHSGEHWASKELKSSKELKNSRDRRTSKSGLSFLKREVNLDLAFQRTMFLLGVKYHFGGPPSESTTEDSSENRSASLYGPVTISNESKQSLPKGEVISNFFSSGGLLTVNNIIDILPVVKHIHKISSEEGTALSRLALTQKGNKARKIFELANKRFEECIQIKPDDHFALYNWAFALRKQALLSSGLKARELWALVSEKYNQALVLHPKDWQALGQWGTALVMQAQQFPDQEEKLIARAFDLLSQASDLAPLTHFKTSFNAGGVCLIYARIFERTLDMSKQRTIVRRAVDHFENALDSSPSSLPAMQNLAIALSKEAALIQDKEERKRAYERSATYFQRVHTKDPKNKYLLFHWGTAILAHVKTTLAQDPSKGNKDLQAAGEKFRLAISISTGLYMDGLLGLGTVIALCRAFNSQDKSGRRAKYIARFGLLYLESVKLHFYQKKMLPPEVFQTSSFLESHQDVRISKLAKMLLADHLKSSMTAGMKNTAPLRRSKSYGGREQSPINEVRMAAGPPSARFQTLAGINFNSRQHLTRTDGISSTLFSNSSADATLRESTSETPPESFWERFKEKNAKNTQQASSLPRTSQGRPEDAFRRKESWWKRQRSFSAMDRGALYSVPSEEEESSTPPHSDAKPSRPMGALVKRFSGLMGNPMPLTQLGVLKPKMAKVNSDRPKTNRPLPLASAPNVIFSVDPSGLSWSIPESNTPEDQEPTSYRTTIFNKKHCIVRTTNKSRTKAQIAFAFSHPCLEKTQQIFQTKTHYYTLSVQIEGRPFLSTVSSSESPSPSERQTENQAHGSLSRAQSPTGRGLHNKSKRGDGFFVLKHQKPIITTTTEEQKHSKITKSQSDDPKRPNKKDSSKSLDRISTPEVLLAYQKGSEDKKPSKRDSQKALLSQESAGHDTSKRFVKKPSSGDSLGSSLDDSRGKNKRDSKQGDEKEEFPKQRIVKKPSDGASDESRNSPKQKRALLKREKEAKLGKRESRHESSKSNNDSSKKNQGLESEAKIFLDTTDHVFRPAPPEPEVIESEIRKPKKMLLQIPSLTISASVPNDRSWRSRSLPARLPMEETFQKSEESASGSDSSAPKLQIDTEALKFYIAEMAMTLDFFEEIGYTYTDFNPNSIFLSDSGHLVIHTCWEDCYDLSFSKTPLLYLSPEVTASLPTRKRLQESGADFHHLDSWAAEDKRLPWWALGVFFYTILIGKHPFVISGEEKEPRFGLGLVFPPNTDTHLKYFFELMLDKKVENRLSSLALIKSHPFFQDFNWDSLQSAFSEFNLSMLNPPFGPS